MGERIRELRRVLKLTQQEFSDRLGIKRGALANYEVGRNEPIDAVVSLICREFQVNEVWLRTGAGDMFLPLTEDEALARFLGEVTFGPDSFRRRFLLALSRMDDEQWAALEKPLSLFKGI